MNNERIFEINGNLGNILNYPNFEITICRIRSRFIELFGDDIMSSIPLYVDNATDTMSGHTPIITPIFGKYLCIKLGLSDFRNTEQIIYQFSHELCHYVFYSLHGIDKPLADAGEEMICSAMSLCILKEFCNNIHKYIDYVNSLENVGYRNGGILAKSLNYSSSKLATMIMDGFDSDIRDVKSKVLT